MHSTSEVVGLTKEEILTKFKQNYPNHQPPLTPDLCGTYLNALFPNLKWSRRIRKKERTKPNMPSRRTDLRWIYSPQALSSIIVDKLTHG